MPPIQKLVEPLEPVESAYWRSLAAIVRAHRPALVERRIIEGRANFQLEKRLQENENIRRACLMRRFGELKIRFGNQK